MGIWNSLDSTTVVVEKSKLLVCFSLETYFSTCLFFYQTPRKDPKHLDKPINVRKKP